MGNEEAKVMENTIVNNMNTEKAINKAVWFHKSAINNARLWASQFKNDSSRAVFEEFLADLDQTLTEMQEDYHDTGDTKLSGDSK